MFAGKGFRVIVAFSLWLLSSSYCFGQKENNIWYFGSNAGLSFTSGSPVVLLNSAMNTNEGTTSVADGTGNLLFYSDGVTVWNRNHVPMPNGTGLMGHYSATQSVIALKKPGSQTIYYLFTVDAIENNLQNGLRYSILDMSLAGGMGDITTKNVLLETPVTEKLTAVHHANTTDFWILSHKWNSNGFSAYHLSANGINTTPVVSYTGAFISGAMGNAIGQLKSNPAGTKLAAAIRDADSFQLFDFNAATGVISNPVTSGSFYSVACGVEFSPDGSKLYATAAFLNSVFQFDMNAPNIFSSGTLITTSPVIPTTMQIGPDGKVYVTERNSTHLSVINNPNAAGTACNFVYQGLYLGGRRVWFGLPNYITTNPQPGFSFTGPCTGTSINFTSSGFPAGTPVSWHFGDPGSGTQNTSTAPNPSHTFSSPGTYQVTLVVNRPGNPVTVVKTVVATAMPTVNLGNDTSLCAGQTLVLGKPPVPGFTYKWQNNSTNSQFFVNSPGTYVLEVTLNGCKAVDSIRVTYPNPVVNLGNDTSMCPGYTLLLGKPPVAGQTYKWQDNSTNANFWVTGPGTYVLEVTKGGCTAIDSIRVTYINPPAINLGNDSMLCAGQTLLLGKPPVAGLTYKWQDNSTNSTFLVTSPGYYFLETMMNGCRSIDHINVSYTNLQVNLGNDTSLCAGQTLVLGKPSVTGLSYKWQDNSTNSTLLVNSPGTYVLEISQNGCQAIDSIRVRYTTPPTVNLGNDTTLCEGLTLLLGKPPVAGLTYKWQDGSANSTLLVTRPGTYVLEAGLNGCKTVDSIEVRYITPATIDLGKDTVICEGETLLLGKQAIAGLGYLWQDGSTNSTFRVTKAGTYKLQVFKDNCPMVQDEVRVTFRDCSLFIPNIITPNQDGLNDAFKIRGLEFEDHGLRIFNRWGVLVYETESYQNNWDAKDAASGVYFFLLKHRQTRKTYKGWLEVVK